MTSRKCQAKYACLFALSVEHTKIIIKGKKDRKPKGQKEQEKRLQ